MSNTHHNAIIEAGSKDCPPMLAPEAEAVQIILTGIDNDIHSTVDACPNAYEMWKAIERLKQGESINVQDLETNLYWEFGKFTSHDELKNVSYHKLYDNLRQHQHEVTKIRAERIARITNPLALVAQQQPVYHPQTHHTHYTQNSSTISHQATTRNRGKAIVNSLQPIYNQEPSMVAEDDETSKDKEIDKLMALISLSFKKIYKPTNNNLRTSSNTSRANQDNSPRINRSAGYENQRTGNVAGARETIGSTMVQKSGIQCYNCKEFGHVARECQKPKRAKDAAYHRENMLLCKQDEAGIQLNAEQADWRDDTDDDKLEDQELENDDDNDLANKHSLRSQLETQKTQFLNEIDRLSREYYYANHMNAILGVYTELDEVTNLQCDYLELLEKCECLETELSKSKMMLKSFEALQKHAINLEIDLQQCIVISELKKLIEKLKGKSMDTKFEKSSVIRQPNAFKSQIPTVLGKPTTFSNSFERSNFSKSTSVTQNNVSNDFSKPVTAQTLPPNKKSILKNMNVLAPGMYKLYTDHNQARTSQLPQDSRKTNKCVSFSTGVILTTSVSRPRLKSNPMGDRVMRNNSQGKKQEVEDQRRNVKLPKNNMSVTACNDSLNAKTLNVNSLVKIVLFIIDSRCSKHMMGNLKLLINFVEKFLGTVKFKNDQIAPILGYGDLVQGAVTIKRVYYVKGLNHNLFFVGQFCDADLDVAFRKSTCYIRDLKGNDLLTASSSQAWLCHRRLSHLNFNTINLLSKNDIVVGLPKLKFVKDHLCSSCELGKAKRKYTWAHFLRSKDETPEVLIDFLRLVRRGLQAQNHSLVIPRHEKTAYHIINDRKLLVKFFHIFGSLSYIVGDGKNLDKMKEKGDECIFVGYSTQSRAYRVFNKRTRVIMESIYVNFNELPHMASDQVSSDPAPVYRTVTTSNELDLLFSLMFDELLNGSSKVVSKSSAVYSVDAPNQRQQHTTPLNNHTTPAPTCQVLTLAPTVSSSENINQAEAYAKNDQVTDDEFINILCTPVQDRGETLSRHVD
nr:hypothetical protein [Tanacetum cinerariifolium]